MNTPSSHHAIQINENAESDTQSKSTISTSTSPNNDSRRRPVQQQQQQSKSVVNRTTKRPIQRRTKIRRPHVLDNACIRCAKNFVLPSIVTSLTCVAWVLGTFILIPTAFMNNVYALVFHQILASSEVALLLTSYFKCVRTDPGSVDENWETEKTIDDIDRRTLLSLETNKHGESRYCHKCGVFQPPRSHHSRAMNKCVLRMDHFCVWVNNVVGAFNHKFFYLFLFYVVVGILHYFTIIVFYVIRVAQNFDAINPIAFVVLIMFTVFLLPISLMVVMFFAWNTYLLATNQTSIENHINAEISSRLRYIYHKKNEAKELNKTTFKHIYHVNIMDNVKSVLGDNVLLWLLPVIPSGFDGYHFKTIPMDEVERINAYIQEAKPTDYDSSDDSDDDNEYPSSATTNNLNSIV
jgi:hypothetical protein